MAARDTFHEAVKSALQKDGWCITHDPLYINFAEVEIYIDLGAERLIAAEKDEAKIAVEIKTFLKPSAISEFHTVLGQFLNYRFALKAEDPDRFLYLAIPLEIYETFFARRFVQLITQEYQLKLIVFEPTKEEIVQWQN
ncbi:MAG: fatty-acid oxidation protein subunit alpha [Moorea sp. SIO4G2]|uniref:XisH family protein n=1 Tax=Moorena sp. SIO3H5 TaxID=2607834 RepID=UPI0013BE44C8|nr:XisH family protein [Moorena sp. SIO3H5]NEO60188.1 fatty-acid oxidation protein subunit alpha [Moorena sp. SIO4G2]NEO69658.1 fatty-acid oxidation protein subunit alpha [Moorena sp. SIO3H5]